MTIMTTKKTKKISWDESGEREFTKFADYICHCRDFAETIAAQKGHPAVTGEDVADAIQTYAALWSELVSKKKRTSPSTAKSRTDSPPAAAVLDEAIQKQVDELQRFIKEEQSESGDSGFGDPKARIAYWKREIEELKHPSKKT